MSNIKTREELIEIIYSNFKERKDCCIEITNPYTEESIYFISSRIFDNAILVSICAGNKSIGNLYPIYDLSGLHKWIEEYANELFLEENVLDINVDGKEEINSTIDIDKELLYAFSDNCYRDNNKDELEGYYELTDFKYDYLTKHNRIKLLQNPQIITTRKEAFNIFGDFLLNDKWDKLIFSFSIYIPDLDITYYRDLVVDKFYLYGRSFISFITVRPDMCNINFKDIDDCIFEFSSNHKSSSNLLKQFKRIVSEAVYRILALSKEEIKIEVYSNYKYY